MLIQLETQLIWYGREYEPGETVDLPDDDARRFIERGMALPVAEAPIENAMLNMQGTKNGRILPTGKTTRSHR